MTASNAMYSNRIPWLGAQRASLFEYIALRRPAWWCGHMVLNHRMIKRQTKAA